MNKMINKNLNADILFIGSGYSVRKILNNFDKTHPEKKFILLSPETTEISRFGLNHSHGNINIQKNITIGDCDIKKLENLHLNKSVKIKLETKPSKKPSLKIKNIKKIKRINIDIKEIYIYKSSDEFFWNVKLTSKNNKTLIIRTNIIFLGLSYGMQQLQVKIKDYKNYFNEKRKLFDNWSTIFYPDKDLLKKITLANSSSDIKYSNFVNYENTNFHFYLKKFRFEKFEFEWQVMLALSLLKSLYVKQFLKYIFYNPKVIFLIFKRFLKSGSYGIYISCESNALRVLKKDKENILIYFCRKYNLSKSMKRVLKKSLDNLYSNSHFHSDYKICPYKNIYIIGSSSLNKTFSANPTAFISKQIAEISNSIIF